MLTHRLQILLDEGQFRSLEAEARRCHASVAAVIREAIDHRLGDDGQRRRLAAERILAAETAPVPDDPHDIRRGIDEEHERKFGPW